MPEPSDDALAEKFHVTKLEKKRLRRMSRRHWSAAQLSPRSSSRATACFQLPSADARRDASLDRGVQG
jgi:hypothetical protein